MKKVFFLFAICLAAYACSDSDNGIGLNIRPDADIITPIIRTFDVATDTKPFDGGVYANATMYLVGRHDNTRYGTTEASLLAAVTYPEQNLEIPEGAVADSLQLRLSVAAHVGNDALQLTVYKMNSKLNFGEKQHTDINVDSYVDFAQVLGSETFSTAAINQIDTTLKNSGVPYIYVNLKPETAEQLMAAPYTSEAAFQDFFNGIYIASTAGNTMLYVATADLILKYRAGGETTTLVFPSNNEVKKVNRISHDGLATPDTATYIYSPAGLYSQVSIPLSEILETICSNPQKTPALNAVYLTVEAEAPQGADSLPLPAYLALVPESEVISFFENNNLPDQKKSFYTILTSTDNKYAYTFDLTYYLQEKIKGSKALPPDYYALTPVTPTFSSTALTDLKNDPQLRALTTKRNLRLTVIYSEFYKFEGK